MELTGEQSFEAPADVIWETVFRPEVLTACIPGAQSVEQTSATRFEGSVKRGLAAVTVEMDLAVDIVDDERPDRVVVELEGSDNRINSSVDGEAEIEIDEIDDTSVLTYTATLNFTGKLASLGGRLIKRSMTNDLKTFFSNLEEYIANEVVVE